MDAATAAAMSDPDRNKWFRRRWSEPPQSPARTTSPGQPTGPVELTGYALLEQWRRTKEQADAHEDHKTVEGLVRP